MGAILITGASGYIGGRLAQHLVDAGVDIRVAGRDPRRLIARWPGVDAVELDVMRPETTGAATEGVTTAYYLIHSMEEGGAPFEEQDRTAATNFARAAAESGVERIVYLVGLGDVGGVRPVHAVDVLGLPGWILDDQQQPLAVLPGVLLRAREVLAQARRGAEAGPGCDRVDA